MDIIENNNEFKTWAIACHLIAFIGFALPFGNIVAVVIIWLFKRRESDFVNKNGKESINFQILCSLVFAVCLLLWPFGIGFIIALLFGLYALFEIILASIKANHGLVYEYKYSIRLFT